MDLNKNQKTLLKDLIQSCQTIGEARLDGDGETVERCLKAIDETLISLGQIGLPKDLEPNSDF